MGNSRWDWKGVGWILIIFPWISMAAPHSPLTWEDRVRAQEAIERVHYEHRIWPKENPGPKPPFEQMISRAQIEAKVEDTLKKSAALEKFWQRPIQPEQLQAEMDRMARQTKAPETLKELFAALGNDPTLIAECLARPVLADRLIRNWYAYDARFHAEAREKAAKALQELQSTRANSQGGHWFREIMIMKQPAFKAQTSSRHRDEKTIILDDEAFKAQAALFPASGTKSSIVETTEAFIIRLTESKTDTTITGTILVFRKFSFDDWLKSLAFSIAEIPAMAQTPYLLPTLNADHTSSPKGSWKPLFYVPDPRYYHSSIWTGTEMIVWGGSWYGEMNSGGRYNPATDTWIATSTGFNCPVGRANHTAVWTGREMIIWGGSYLDAGGRYDPVTDNWLPTSLGENCPSIRSGHTAVWTGTEMIIWGGGDNTGGRYDPDTDTWRPTSTGGNCPAYGSGHTAVWTGQEMIVWGSDGARGRYNPSTNTWKSIRSDSGSPSDRYEHTAVWTGTLMIIWGGISNNSSLNTGGRYDPGSDSWLTTTTDINCPAPRSNHTAVWTGSEMIVWGGSYSEYNTGGRYDPIHNTWRSTSTGADCPSGRGFHTAVWTGVEMIIWGGSFYGQTNTGGRYNPLSDSWLPTSTGPSHPPFLQSSTAIWTGAEMIVWGGYDQSILECVDSGLRYDPSIDSWQSTSSVGDCPLARRLHSAVWTGTEMIIWGGDAPYESYEKLNSGGRYNPTANNWARTSEGLSVPSGRAGHDAVWSGAEMIVWGGDDDGRNQAITGGRYNPSADTWSPTSIGDNCPTPRYYSSAIWTGKEMIVWGGEASIGVSGTYLNDGARYNPLSDIWTPISTGPGCPSPRRNHSAIWTGEQMIIWGGSFYSRDIMNSGGKYDPLTDSWSSTSAIGDCPSGRILHSAVWTGAEMIVWGGVVESAYTSNSGGWYSPDLDRWVATPTDLNVPYPRNQHLAVWTGKSMIIWGPWENGGILFPSFPHERPVEKP